METIKEMENDKKIIETKYEEVSRLNEELNRKIKQLTAMQETGKAILSVLDLDQLLSVIMNLLFSVCQINRAIIMLVNEEKHCLEYIHGVGFETKPSSHKELQGASPSRQQHAGAGEQHGAGGICPGDRCVHVEEGQHSFERGETGFRFCGSPDHQVQSHRGDGDRRRGGQGGAQRQPRNPGDLRPSDCYRH